MAVQKLSPSKNEYLCFQIERKTDYEEQCDKTRALTKVMETFTFIESFQHNIVILKGLFNSERLKQHMVTIGVDQ